MFRFFIQNNVFKLFLKGTIPGQLVIQYTNKCNALCPQCGMRMTESIPRSKLNVDNGKKIIDSAAKKGVKILRFTGGEPFLFLDEIISLLKYAENAGIKYTMTGTNGFMFMNYDSPHFLKETTKIVEKLAETKIYSFWISLDSAVPEVHEEMRGLPGVMKGIEKALPVFHEHGIYPVANFVINRNIAGFWKQTGLQSREFYEYFKEAYRNFFRFVIKMGFTSTAVSYPMSIGNIYEDINPVHLAVSRENVVRFSPDEKACIFKALFDVIPEFRHKLRIFNPSSSLYSLIRKYSSEEESCYPCRGGLELLFVDAKGDTYPCGFRGLENLGKLWELDSRNNNFRPSCVKCDWQCFRDTSELFGPALDVFTKPLKFLNRVFRNNQYMRLWMKDILYYKACNFFNGRIPPDYEKLSKFANC